MLALAASLIACDDADEGGADAASGAGAEAGGGGSPGNGSDAEASGGGAQAAGGRGSEAGGAGGGAVPLVDSGVAAPDGATGGAGGAGPDEPDLGAGGGAALAGPTFYLQWNGDFLHFEVQPRAEDGSYTLGLAETGSGANGWYGEDCLEGASGGVDVCHPVYPEGLLDLSHAESVAEVDDFHTLLAGDMAPAITYVLRSDSGGCWTWGHDTAYYTDALECAISAPENGP